MTQIFASGIDKGNFTDWDSKVESGATITPVTDKPHHGFYSAKLVQTAADDYAYLQKDFTNVPSGSIFARMSLYIDSIDMGDNADLAYLLAINDGVGQRFSLALRNIGGSQNINYGIRETISFGITYAEVDLVTDKWYGLELEAYIGVAGYVKLYTNGELVATKDEIDTSAWEFNRVRVGMFTAAQLHAFTGYFDCIMVADAYMGLDEPASSKVVRLDLRP